MRCKFILGLLLIVQLSFCQNSHDILLGINYPNSFNGEMLARGVGFETGYNYGRFISDKFSISTGLEASIYNRLSWDKYTSIEFYLPIKLGYDINNFSFKAGVSLNAAQFLTFTEFSGNDPEVAPVQQSPYVDLNSKRTFGIGLNLNLDYRLTDRYMIYVDYRTISLNDEYIDDKKYNYGLTSIGLKIRFKNRIVNN